MLAPDFFLNLVHTFGYAGVFLASLIGSASVILPLPSFTFVFAAGSLLNPMAVGILAGIGSAIGELTGYGVGYGISYRIRHKSRQSRKEKRGIMKNKWFAKAKTWSKKRSMFVVVFIFAATPLPDDVIGIICGSVRYDIKKFFIASMLGKIVLSLILAYAGFYGIEWVKGLFT